MELSECQATLATILEEITPDPAPVKSGERGLRASGLALQIAVTLMEVCFPLLSLRLRLQTTKGDKDQRIDASKRR